MSTLAELVDVFNTLIADNIVNKGKIGEDEIQTFVNTLVDISPKRLDDWSDVFQHIIEISYLDNISNFRDYLYLVYATAIFPKELTEYESVEHIFHNPFENANQVASSMPYSARNISEFVTSIRIIIEFGDSLTLSKNEALDKVFQSVGIKYNTVESFFKEDKYHKGERSWQVNWRSPEKN